MKGDSFKKALRSDNAHRNQKNVVFEIGILSNFFTQKYRAPHSNPTFTIVYNFN